MKKKIITWLLSAACLVSVFGAFGVPVSAAEVPTVEYATVVFKDAVDLRYFVKSGESGTTELLVWTDIPENKQFTKATADDVITDYYNDSVSVPGETYKAFTYDKVAARQMGDVYYVCALYTEGGTELYGKVVKYGIQQYAHNMLGLSGKPAYSGDDADTLLPLLESMLEYGANAQRYFDYKTDRLVDAKTVDVKVVNGEIAEDGAKYGIYYPGDTVKLTAPETDANGKVFSHWENANGEKVTVPYMVTGDEEQLLTFTAVYAVPVKITAKNGEVDEDNTTDLKKLFTITEGGKSVTVADSMIDAGEYVSQQSAKGNYTITLTYVSSDGVTYTATANLEVTSAWIGPF